jgi:hypothetical protein
VTPSGSVAVPVRCIAAAGKTCRGLLVVRAGRAVAATRSFSLTAGRATRLTVQLGARARRASSISVSAPHALARAYRLLRA